MSDATAAIKRVPKWAWIASAGISGGIIFMRMRANNGSQTDKGSAGDVTAPGDYSQAVSSFPATGTVESGYSGGAYGTTATGSDVDLPSLIDSLGNLVAVTQPAPPDWATIFASLPGYAGGGGAPTSATGGSTVSSDAAPTPPNPTTKTAVATPAAAPAYTTRQVTRTRNNGKSGKDRRVWCACVTIHDYKNPARSVVVSERKVLDGACWAEEHACS